MMHRVAAAAAQVLASMLGSDPAGREVAPTAIEETRGSPC